VLLHHTADNLLFN